MINLLGILKGQSLDVKILDRVAKLRPLFRVSRHQEHHIRQQNTGRIQCGEEHIEELASENTAVLVSINQVIYKDAIVVLHSSLLIFDGIVDAVIHEAMNDLARLVIFSISDEESEWACQHLLHEGCHCIVQCGFDVCSEGGSFGLLGIDRLPKHEVRRGIEYLGTIMREDDTWNQAAPKETYHSTEEVTHLDRRSISRKLSQHGLKVLPEEPAIRDVSSSERRCYKLSGLR